MKLGNDDIFNKIDELVEDGSNVCVLISENGDFQNIIHTTKSNLKFIAIDLDDGEIKIVEPNKLTVKELKQFLRED